MYIKKYSYILIIIFISVLGTRLFCASQTPTFNHEAYFSLRQTENIYNTGLPIVNDNLVHGGRSLLFPPLFYYLLTLLNLFLPITFAAKILPNIFASLVIFIVYKIAKDLSGNRLIALFSALMSGFLPISFNLMNNVSPISLSIPIIFLSLYLLMNIKKNKKYLNYLLVIIVLFPFIHSSAILLVIALIFYLLIIRISGLIVLKQEKEITLFATIYTTWALFTIFKDAFLLHGHKIIWQNIPDQILSNYFTRISVGQFLAEIGFLPLILGIIVIYWYLFKTKNRDIYLFLSLIISCFILLWLRLVPPVLGLTIIGIALTILSAEFFRSLSEYIDQTKITRYKMYIYLFLVLIFIFTSIPASIHAAHKVISQVPSSDIINAVKWLKTTPKNSVILATIEEGSLIAYFAGRKNVLGTDFLLIKNSEQKFDDVKEIYTTNSQIEATKLLNRYNINYILFSDHAKKQYKVKGLGYTENNCFELVYNKQVQIYRSSCKVEER